MGGGAQRFFLFIYLFSNLFVYFGNESDFILTPASQLVCSSVPKRCLFTADCTKLHEYPEGKGEKTSQKREMTEQTGVTGQC